MSVAGPPREPPEPILGIDERACLLRAARRQLRSLQAELHRLESLPSNYAAGPVAATQAELNCLTRAVNWLWFHHAKA